MTVAKEDVRSLAETARAASRVLATVPHRQKDAALQRMARHLRAAAPVILAANAEDLAAARKAGKNAAFLDRLLLDAQRLEAMARAVEAVADAAGPRGRGDRAAGRAPTACRSEGAAAAGRGADDLRVPPQRDRATRPRCASRAATRCILRGGSECAALQPGHRRGAARRGWRRRGLPGGRRAAGPRPPSASRCWSCSSWRASSTCASPAAARGSSASSRRTRASRW